MEYIGSEYINLQYAEAILIRDFSVYRGSPKSFVKQFTFDGRNHGRGELRVENSRHELAFTAKLIVGIAN